MQAADPKFPGRRIELPGRGRTFVREAAGPPGAPTVVLLHGLNATAGLNWLPSVKSLAQHYRVIALDHRGHGRGIRLHGRFRLADCADDVVHLADVLGIERFLVAGYSMGGAIAQLTALRASERVAGMVLCATAGTFGPRRNRRAVRLFSPLVHGVARLVPASVWRSLGDRIIEVRANEERVRAWIARETMGTSGPAVVDAAAAVARFSSRSWLGGIDLPSAVVLTERDQLVPPAWQRDLVSALAAPEVFPIPADHLACATRVDLFAPALTKACHSVAKRAGLSREVDEKSDRAVSPALEMESS